MQRMRQKLLLFLTLGVASCCCAALPPATQEESQTAAAMKPQAATKILPCRWVYIANDLSSDSDLDTVSAWLRTAATNGYTGVILDTDFTGIPQWSEEKTTRVQKVRDICARIKLDIVPMIMSAGYGDGLVTCNLNLAEGLPVRDAVFQVKNGVADIVPECPLAKADGHLETAVGDKAAGLDQQDEPGKKTFVDKQVTHDGLPSLRFEPETGKGDVRIMKELPKQGKHYMVRFWVKAEELNPSRIELCLYDGNRQVHWFPIDVDSKWKMFEYPVLTADMKDPRVYIGVWNSKRGKFWVSGLEIFETGLVNVLRRPGTPLTVRKETGGEVCVEGRDFAPVSDPALKINQAYHTPPTIRSLRGGNLHDGDRLLVSYYAPPLMLKGQIVTCMSEPQVYDLWEKAVAKTWDMVRPHYWFLNMDEIRCGGTCQACRDRKNADGTPMTPAQILGDCITRQFGMIRKVCPNATVVMWSDMLDPNHNGKSEYYFVPGGYAGAWKYVPRELVMCPWWVEHGKESLAFFEGLGMRTLAGAYYDADSLDECKVWLDLERSQPHGCGIAYITWDNKYDLMPDFGKMASSPDGAIPAKPAVVPIATASTAITSNLLTTTAPATNDPSWKPLFADHLAGWTIAKGSWQMTNGCVVCDSAGEIGARIDSQQTFGDCELTCSLYSEDCKFASVQLRDRMFVINWPYEKLGSWRTFRLVSKGGLVQASLDGETLQPQGTGIQSDAGDVRIFVGSFFSITIKDAKMRSL